MDLPIPSDIRFWLERLEAIFSAMDAAYDRAAAAAGFRCAGCEDNCCLTLFHHHTLLEYLHLKDGLDALNPDARREAGRRAGEVCRRMAEAEGRGAALRVMCPMNLDGRCTIYDRRPMICRLHGIPHEMRRPDGSLVRGPGCEAFAAVCGRESGIFLDRTPYYRDMAALEGELRRTLRFNGKIRMTVASMVREICAGRPAADGAAAPQGENNEMP